MALPAPRLFLALLLMGLLLTAIQFMAASLLAAGSDQHNPSCTRDALTVPRGQLAVMTCSMSTPLFHVTILLSVPGEASQLIFGVDGPGHFSNKGWRLEVQGGKARLVIPDAQPAQAGNYTWRLVGRHRSVGHTSLHVSVTPELLVTEAASTPPAAPGTWPPTPASTVSPVPVPVLLVIIMSVLLAIVILAVIIALTCDRACSSQNPQMQML